MGKVGRLDRATLRGRTGMKKIFRIGAMIRFREAIHDVRQEWPILLIVKRIDGRPDGKYWDWECISGGDRREIIQNHEEWMYEAVE